MDLVLRPKQSVKCLYLVTYLSWVPAEVEGQDRLNPFEPGSMVDGTIPLNPPTVNRPYDSRYIGGISNEAASVYIATRSPKLLYDPNAWHLLKCSLFNASYTVNINSDSSGQGVFSTSEMLQLNTVPFLPIAPRRFTMMPLATSYSAELSYLALMKSLGRLLVGTISGDYNSEIDEIDYYEEIRLNVQNSGLSQTLLPFTAELLPFLGNQLGPNQWTIVDTVTSTYGNKTISLPNEAFTSSTFNRSLGPAIEELFQNMTLSLQQPCLPQRL